MLGSCDEYMFVAGWAGRRELALADVTAGPEFGD